jgi:hypothetical protein
MGLREQVDTGAQDGAGCLHVVEDLLAWLLEDEGLAPECPDCLACNVLANSLENVEIPPSAK